MRKRRFEIRIFSRGRILLATHVNFPRLQGTQPGTLTICMENAYFWEEYKIVTVHPGGIPLKNHVFPAFTGPTKIVRTICLNYQCQASSQEKAKH